MNIWFCCWSWCLGRLTLWCFVVWVVVVGSLRPPSLFKAEKTFHFSIWGCRRWKNGVRCLLVWICGISLVFAPYPRPYDGLKSLVIEVGASHSWVWYESWPNKSSNLVSSNFTGLSLLSLSLVSKSSLIKCWNQYWHVFIDGECSL